MTETIEKSLLDLDFAALTRRKFTPSPAAWRDQVLYYLLLGGFSDGKERGGYLDEGRNPASGGVTPLYRPKDAGQLHPKRRGHRRLVAAVTAHSEN